MRRWVRAVGGASCGGPCGAAIPDGAPMLLIEIRKLTKARCERCAGEPAPATFTPSHAPMQLKPLGFTAMSEWAKESRFDYKRAQSGDA